METALWRPLASTSFHAPFVHSAWTTAQQQRIKNRFSDFRAARFEVDLFNKKLVAAGCVVPSAKNSSFNSLPIVKASSWLVLPFRPEFKRGLGEVIAKINSEFAYLGRYLFLFFRTT